jgi:hypothetical protein
MSEHERWIGRRIGAYEIVALIGSGGMGDVYRARRIDAQYEKEVAIKLVPAAVRASFLLQRLRAERRILATLDHPHIARLIEGGATPEGVPYLVLDLVEGVPLDRYCETHELPVRKRLQLFRDVCSAVSYAHQQLVVHRDLKPENIFVTSDGTVKLLDFGIAKLLQSPGAEVGAGQTLFAPNTATLEFASPEQVLGKTLTTASDVYSLGVVLYLLLTRRLPYLNSAAPSQHEAIREICEFDPAPPTIALPRAQRRLGEKLDADLDAITLRALRKEPEQRYRSVEEFSDDVQRYLEGKPVVARDGQFVYRAAKFVRRRKLEITAAALMVTTLAGGIVAFVQQARIADEQRARAERHLTTVRNFAELSMFQLHDAIKDLPGATSARQLLLSTAQHYLNALGAEAHDDRALQHDIAIAYAKVADIQGKAYNANTGKPTAAIESYAKSIELLEPLVAADAGDTAKQNVLAQSHLQQSRLLVLQGETKKAVAGSRRAVDIYERLAQKDSGATTQGALADAVRVHAVNLSLDGERHAAVPFTQRAIDMLEALHAAHPDDLTVEYQLAVAYGTAGDLANLGDLSPEAQKRSQDLHLKALAVDEHLYKITEGRNATYARAVLSDRVNLCSQLNDAKEFVRAIEFCRAAQPLMKELSADASNIQIQIDAGSFRWNLGSALLGAEQLDEAAEVLEENAKALQALPAESHTLQVEYLIAASEAGLGSIQASLASAPGLARAERLRRWKLAKQWFEKATPRFERVTKQISLDYPDKTSIDDAIAGLERSGKEIEKLEGDVRR